MTSAAERIPGRKTRSGTRRPYTNPKKSPLPGRGGTWSGIGVTSRRPARTVRRSCWYWRKTDFSLTSNDCSLEIVCQSVERNLYRVIRIGPGVRDCTGPRRACALLRVRSRSRGPSGAPAGPYCPPGTREAGSRFPCTRCRIGSGNIPRGLPGLTWR